MSENQFLRHDRICRCDTCVLGKALQEQSKSIARLEAKVAELEERLKPENIITTVMDTPLMTVSSSPARINTFAASVDPVADLARTVDEMRREATDRKMPGVSPPRTVKLMNGLPRDDSFEAFMECLGRPLEENEVVVPCDTDGWVVMTTEQYDARMKANREWRTGPPKTLSFTETPMEVRLGSPVKIPMASLKELDDQFVKESTQRLRKWAEVAEHVFDEGPPKTLFVADEAEGVDPLLFDTLSKRLQRFYAKAAGVDSVFFDATHPPVFKCKSTGRAQGNAGVDLASGPDRTVSYVAKDGKIVVEQIYPDDEPAQPTVVEGPK